jgi:hypothetical protein
MYDAIHNTNLVSRLFQRSGKSLDTTLTSYICSRLYEKPDSAIHGRIVIFSTFVKIPEKL